MTSSRDRTNGYMGTLYGVDFKIDPNCPPGMLYMINENNMEFTSIDARSRWQRFQGWLKAVVRKLV